jgi:hypothetical protein
MQTRVRCGVEYEFTGERYVAQTREYEQYTEMRKCGRSRKAHQETVSIKRKGEKKGVRVVLPPKVTDHEYGDEYSFEVACRHCGEPIKPGTQYAYWLSKNRGKVVQHASCPSPNRSFWTNSEILSTAWGIQDQEVPNFETVEELEDWATEVGDQIRTELVEMIEEKMDNIESGFGHSDVPVYYELEERKDAFEQWADMADDISSYVSEDTAPCAACQRPEDEHEEDDEECDEFDPDYSFLTDAAHELLGECPE